MLGVGNMWRINTRIYALIKHKTGCIIGISIVIVLLCWAINTSSDAYVYENMEKCHVVHFCDGGWMKIKIYDGNGLFSFHGLGAIYAMDSLGRRRKVSGRYVKRESFSWRMLEKHLSKCKSLDQAWADSVWDRFVNYGYKVEDWPVQFKNDSHLDD